VTINEPTLARKDTGGRTSWLINAISANASGTEELKAAPGAGKNLYVTYVSIDFDDDIQVTLKDATAALLGPVSECAAWDFSDNPIKLTANQALNVTAGAGNIHVLVRGFTQ